MSAGGGQGNWGPWPVQNQAAGPPGVLPGQVKVTSGDTDPHYLGAKIVSTSGNVPITQISGEQVNLNGLPSVSFSFFMAIDPLSVDSTGFLAPNDPANFYTEEVELSVPFVVKNATVSGKLITNGVPVGPTITIVATRNGSNIIGPVANVGNTSPVGSLSPETGLTHSTDAGDTYGLSWGSGPASGNIMISLTLTLSAY